MLEPAHDAAVAPQHLHAVDAEIEAVLARLARPVGDHQRPGDQGSRFARPAALHRQPAEIDLIAGPHHLLAGRRADGARLHGHHGLEQRRHLQRLAETAGRLGLAQEGQSLADLAQLVRLAVHAPGHPLDGAEEIDQHRHFRSHAVGAGHVFKQHRRPALGEQPGLNLGQLEHARDRRLDPHQPPGRFQPLDEVPERGVGHELNPRQGCGTLAAGKQEPAGRSRKKETGCTSWRAHLS